MKKIDKAIEILQALKEGKTIEWCSYILHSGEWSDWHEFEFNGKNIDLINSQYRIKKQSTYRPYANAKEFLNASKEHGPYLEKNTNYYYAPVHVGNNGIDVCFISNTNFLLFKEVLDMYHWQDGTPCGILEQ